MLRSVYYVALSVVLLLLAACTGHWPHWGEGVPRYQQVRRYAPLKAEAVSDIGVLPADRYIVPELQSEASEVQFTSPPRAFIPPTLHFLLSDAIHPAGTK